MPVNYKLTGLMLKLGSFCLGGGFFLVVGASVESGLGTNIHLVSKVLILVEFLSVSRRISTHVSGN